MGDILFLAHRVPYPPDRGDKIRGFNLIRHLSARKPVHLVAFADDVRDLEQKDGLSAYVRSASVLWRGKSQRTAAVQALLSRRPVSLAAFDDDTVRRSVEDVLTRHDIDTIFVFSSQMAQYLPERPRQRVIMDFVDMDSAKFAAYADSARGPMRWMLRREARLLLAHDVAVAKGADASLFVSEAEADLFRSTTGSARVHGIENGIDTDFYNPDVRYAQVDASGPLIVFTGQMDYRPNIEGVTWFVETILPVIRRVHPEATFAVVGRNPTDAVKTLSEHTGVTVTGEVADVRGWLAQASVVVAPLKLARGIQNKVLEGMAMARPVVASAQAAEGIEHGGTIRVGADAGEIAKAVTELLSSPRMAAEFGASARRQVMARYSWQARLAPLDGLLGLQQTSAGTAELVKLATSRTAA